MSFIEEVAPAIVLIIQKLNEKINAQYHDEKVAIIDGENRVHMAHMDIHFSHSVNGVAYLHTEILKNTELHNFYTLYPEKFNNKTTVLHSAAGYFTQIHCFLHSYRKRLERNTRKMRKN